MTVFLIVSGTLLGLWIVVPAVVGALSCRAVQRKIAAVLDHPLTRFENQRTARRIDRRRDCDGLLRRAGAARWTRDETPSTAHGYLVLMWDVWRGNDFDARPLGSSSWFRRQDGPAEDSLDARLQHDYALGDEEKRELRRLQNGTISGLCWTAAQLAHRIAGRQAWQLSFFDAHGARVDLVDELTAITERARALYARQRRLGLAPTGHLRDSPEAVDLYMRKATALDEAIDQLLNRVTAFADYAGVVDHAETKHHTQQYLDRLSSDDLEDAVATEMDRHESTRLRTAADDSAVLASVYIDCRLSLPDLHLPEFCDQAPETNAAS